MTLDLWIHVGTFTVAVLMAPLIRTLVSTLVKLQSSAELLSQSMENHVTAFNRHLDDEVRVRDTFDHRLADMSRDVQEVRSILFGRRNPRP